MKCNGFIILKVYLQILHHVLSTGQKASYFCSEKQRNHMSQICLLDTGKTAPSNAHPSMTKRGIREKINSGLLLASIECRINANSGLPFHSNLSHKV